MNDPHRWDDLIHRVAARAADRCPGTPAPVSARQLAAAEEELGFALHPLLARLYCEVGDGGFGPEYGLFRLATGPQDGAISETEGPLTAAYRARRAANPADPGWFWPDGVVPIMTWGCGMLACVDCRSPEGTVLLFEPNPVDDDWADAWFVDQDSLAAWLETSLSGGGWYTDPDVDDDWGDPHSIDTQDTTDDEPAEMRRWGSQAKARSKTS